MSPARSNVSPRGRGLATLLALLLLVFVGMATAALSSLLITESRRSAATLDEAALRQALLAGEAWALHRAQAGERIDGAVRWPGEADDGVSLVLADASRDGDTVTVTARAVRPGATAEQALTLTRRGDAWAVTSRDLRRPR